MQLLVPAEAGVDRVMRRDGPLQPRPHPAHARERRPLDVSKADLCHAIDLMAAQDGRTEGVNVVLA